MGKLGKHEKFAAVTRVLLAILCTAGVESCSRKVELDPEMQMIATYTFGESREPLTVIQDRVRESYGDPEARLNIERQFAEILKSETATPDCKDFVCRQLRLMGTKESVSELAELLTDETTADMARYALELNPDPGAGNALRNALGKSSGTVRVGIINSLGERRDEKSVKTLEELESSTDSEVASAASAALAKIHAGSR